MARQLNTFPVTPFIGQPSYTPIGLCRASKQEPRAIPIEINWALYPVSSAVQNYGVTVDFSRSVSPDGLLDNIRSVYIDNTFSSIPIYVFFPDTGFTVVAPPGSIVISPVVSLWQNPIKQAIVYGEGFTDIDKPLTKLQFMNVEKDGFYIPTNFSSPFQFAFLGSVSAASSTIFTFNNFPLGVAVADRLIGIGITYFNALAGVNRTISAVSVNGIAATLAVQSGATQQGVGIYSAKVPLLSTGTISVTMSGACDWVGINAWRIANQSSDFPSITAINAGNTPQGITFAVPAFSGSILAAQLGTGTIFTADGPGVSWSNASRRSNARSPAITGIPGNVQGWGSGADFLTLIDIPSRTFTANRAGGDVVAMSIAGANWQ